jgi:pyruvate dehydrogenase E2 component (dihydrolipoamide acetyltransferase)
MKWGSTIFFTPELTTTPATSSTFRGTAFTPIVNYLEVAILGMSRSHRQLQLVDGVPVERLMLPLSLSYDHRVVNGADAARFVVRLAQYFQSIFELLLAR